MLNRRRPTALHRRLVFQWLKRQGGLAGIAAVNAEKARILYEAIDGSGGFYTNPVDPDCRSRMNVPFVLADAALDADFLAESKAAGLASLKGHKSVGGMRASIYNAVSLEACRRCRFHERFRQAPG
jgi:phosphoserine aminotransferase